MSRAGTPVGENRPGWSGNAGSTPAPPFACHEGESRSDREGPMNRIAKCLAVALLLAAPVACAVRVRARAQQEQWQQAGGSGDTARPDRASSPPWQPVPVTGGASRFIISPEERTREDAARLIDDLRALLRLRRAAEWLTRGR